MQRKNISRFFAKISADLVLLVAVAFDTYKHRRLHPVFLWGSIGLIAMQPLRLLLAGTDLWMNFAAALVALVK